MGNHSWGTVHTEQESLLQKLEPRLVLKDVMTDLSSFAWLVSALHYPARLALPQQKVVVNLLLEMLAPQDRSHQELVSSLPVRILSLDSTRLDPCLPLLPSLSEQHSISHI